MAQGAHFSLTCALKLHTLFYILLLGMCFTAPYIYILSWYEIKWDMRNNIKPTTLEMRREQTFRLHMTFSLPACYADEWQDNHG